MTTGFKADDIDLIIGFDESGSVDNDHSDYLVYAKMEEESTSLKGVVLHQGVVPVMEPVTYQVTEKFMERMVDVATENKYKNIHEKFLEVLDSKNSWGKNQAKEAFLATMAGLEYHG